MAYQIIEQYDSPNFDTPEQMPYIQDGEPRVIESGTIHHWDDPANHPTFEGTIATLCNPAAGRSAHNIIQAGRVACIVSAVNCAWHAGNWHGNATSIGYECSPYETDGDYQTIAEKIADDWKAFGVFPLVPHHYWTATSCPGTYDLDRITRMATGIYNNTPTPTPGDDEMALTPTFDGDVRGSLQNITDQVKGLSGFQRDVRADLAQKGQQITVLSAAVGALTAQLGKEQGLDVATITTAVETAIMDGFKIVPNK